MYVLKNRTLVALSTSITQLNCGQLQCIMVVNRPIAVHSECLECFFLIKYTQLVFNYNLLHSVMKPTSPFLAFSLWAKYLGFLYFKVTSYSRSQICEPNIIIHKSLHHNKIECGLFQSSYTLLVLNQNNHHFYGDVFGEVRKTSLQCLFSHGGLMKWHQQYLDCLRQYHKELW